MVGAGSARRIASSIASSQRRATDHSGWLVIGGQRGVWVNGRQATIPVAITTPTATMPSVMRPDTLDTPGE
jgi:hypothetical protein